MQKSLRLFIWSAPLALQSADALAWGLYTHVYFAQCLVWGAVLVDPAFRRALARFPEWVLAGACIPDLALFGFSAGTAVFRDSHTWAQAARLVASCESDLDRALALGYCSHLMVDTVAHNHFVPAHERAWADVPVLTHALSEWAMDSHLQGRVPLPPSELLHRHQAYLAGYVAAQFGCSVRQSTRALTQLKHAEKLLRASRIPQGVYHISRRLDSRTRMRFEHYLKSTAVLLHQVNDVLDGRQPQLDANPAPDHAANRDEGCSAVPRLPWDLFRPRGPGCVRCDHNLSEICAINAPSPAPAATSLG